MNITLLRSIGLAQGGFRLDHEGCFVTGAKIHQACLIHKRALRLNPFLILLSGKIHSISKRVPMVVIKCVMVLPSNSNLADTARLIKPQVQLT